MRFQPRLRQSGSCDHLRYPASASRRAAGPRRLLPESLFAAHEMRLPSRSSVAATPGAERAEDLPAADLPRNVRTTGRSVAGHRSGHHRTSPVQFGRGGSIRRSVGRVPSLRRGDQIGSEDLQALSALTRGATAERPDGHRGARSPMRCPTRSDAPRTTVRVQLALDDVVLYVEGTWGEGTWVEGTWGEGTWVDGRGSRGGGKRDVDRRTRVEGMWGHRNIATIDVPSGLSLRALPRTALRRAHRD